MMMNAIRILHVDDEPDFAELAATYLEREDERFHVETATSASEGLDCLADNGFDCIVSDYDMPRRNGIEFLERVREDHPDLPFVLYTGKGSEEVASEAISAGVTDYLQKETGTSQYTVLAHRIRNAVEQYRSRRALEATEEKLSQLAEKSDDVLFMFTGDWGELLFINSAFEDVWGIPPDRLEDDPAAFLDYIHPEDRDKARDSMRRLSEGQPDDIEYRVIPPEDDRRWIRGQSKPILDDDGTVTRIVGYVRDITERKARERDLQAQVTAMEAATDGISILNEDQEYVYMNESHARIYGFDDPGELLGKTWRACYAETEIPQFEDEILPSLFETGEWQGTMWVTTAEGRSLYQELTLSRVEDGRIVCVVRDLTDQRERERELERYEILIEEVTDSIGVVDEDGTITYANPAIERILGYEPDELEGEVAFEYIHPDDRDEVTERFSSLVSDNSRNIDRMQYRMRHADGSWRWLESEASSQVDTALGGYVMTSRDITDRKQREQTIEDLHKTARTLMQTETTEDVAEIAVDAVRDILDMPANGVHLYDEAEGGLVPVAWTERTEEIVGEPPTFAPGEGVAGRAFETGDPRIYDDISTVADRFNPDTPVRSQIVFPLSDHGVLLIGSPEPDAFDDTDVSLAEIVAIHMRTALDRLERERDLRERSNLLDQIFAQVPTHLYVMDEEAQLRRVSEYYVDDPEARIGLTDREIAPGEFGEEAHADNVSVIETGEPLINKEEYLSSRDKWGLTSKVPWYDEDDEIAGLIGVTRDITKRKEYERELESQIERLEEFASIVSHDLRNPLNIAEGRIELAQEESDSEHLDSAADAVDRSLTLIDDLLTLAREGEAVSEFETVNLSGTIDGCWRNVRTKDATLVTETDRTIRADAGRLKQLLENLIRNAIEHGGDEVAISIGDLDDGLYVADDGPGIPEEEREQVFEAGYSTTEEGTGFGLNIAQEIADAHGWTISVTESQDGGARFEITGIEFTK